MPLTDLEKWKLLAKTDVNQAVSDFGDLSPAEAQKTADRLGVSYLAAVVDQLDTDAATEVLHGLEKEFRDRVLSEVSPDKAKTLAELLAYKPGTAGSLMATEFLSVSMEDTVRGVTDYLKNLSKDQRGRISYIYVVDQHQRLEGVIQIRDLVFHPPETPVRQILKSPVVQVETGMSQLEVARLLQRHRYLGLPVVDSAQKLVGVISADSAMQVLEEEAADDIAKIVGTSAEEMKTHSAPRILRLRLPWLAFNIASGLICALISGIFERDFHTITVLFLFVPVVLGLCESTGVQGATIVVRNISLGHASFRNLNKIFASEALAGIFIGIICGAVVGLVAGQWLGNQKLALALAGSLALAITLSALIGLVLPLGFKKLRIDPAIASGPLVLALCDIQALLVYFTVSSRILQG